MPKMRKGNALRLLGVLLLGAVSVGLLWAQADKGIISGTATALDFDPARPQVTYDNPIETTATVGGSWRDATRVISQDDDLAHLLRANAR